MRVGAMVIQDNQVALIERHEKMKPSVICSPVVR